MITTELLDEPYELAGNSKTFLPILLARLIHGLCDI